MAIYNGRILVRRGSEANFDADKLMPGEWAVSTDKRIVRICISAGIALRMATYDAFEEDMKKIEQILNTCQTIEEALIRINTEVNENANVVAEYTKNAKTYMENAKTSEINAKASETASKTSEINAKESETNAKVSEANAQAVFESLPEDYNTLSKEFYDAAIKQSVSGEGIHVTDSADTKLREFHLYGKAVQETTSGKNKLPYPYQQNSTTIKGVTFTVNSNGIVNVKGTNDGTGTSDFFLIGSWGVNNNIDLIPKENLIVSGIDAKANSGSAKISIRTYTFDGSGKSLGGVLDEGNGANLSKDLITAASGVAVYIVVKAGTTVDTVVYPMIRLATEIDSIYEPYTGGQPSPSPDYLQEIEVSGTSGSVLVKSVNENLIINTRPNSNNLTDNGVTFKTNGDGTYTANGKLINVGTRAFMPLTLTSGEWLYLPKGTYTIYSGLKFETEIGYLQFSLGDVKGTTNVYHSSYNSPKTFTIDKPQYCWIMLGIVGTYSNEIKDVVFKPQIVKGTSVGNFQMHKETTSTIPTPNGLAGIPVSSVGNYTDSNGQERICDEIVKYADGSGERIHRIKHIVMDGLNYSFAGKSSSKNNTVYYLNADDVNRPKSGIGNLKSARFTTITAIEGYNNSIVGMYTERNYTNIYFGFGLDSELTTLELANAWLVENPFDLYYELAEPIRTPLTAEEIAEIEKLCTFNPVTNITNDADCGMSVTYLADSKLYIDNRLAQIEAALVNNI